MNKLSCIAFVLLLGFGSAHAATSADWWVDITNDRTEKVRTHLSVGEDPNAISPNGQPSIMLAIQEGAWEVYDLLLRHRQIDVNIANSTDETPLMYLAVLGETARAADLINKGAQVNRLGWSPLHYAASKAHVDTVKMLLAHKAMVNAPSPDGTSPLMMAAYAGSDDVVRVLLDAGADVTARNLQGEDAADWARRRHHNGLADQLDDLTQRVLQRRAGTAQGGAAGAVSGGAQKRQSDGSVQTLDVRPAETPTIKESEARRPQDGGSSEDSGSASRYFDLDRFDRDEDRF